MNSKKQKILIMALVLIIDVISVDVLAQDEVTQTEVDKQRQSTVANSRSAGAKDRGLLETVTVTGSRIKNSGFVSPTPVTTLDAEEMERLGITNVGDAINRLPAARATSTPQTTGSDWASVGTRNVDLRGLGPTRTLTLVDGRRYVPSNVDGTVNLNLIPSALISSVEAITGGASAAYGSDAVSGVVNMILDRDLEGFRSQVSYGETSESDGEKYQVSLAGGFSVLDGRGHIILSAEYEKEGEVGDCYTRDWCNSSRALVTNLGHGFNGLPANILSADANGRLITYGGVINTIPPTHPLYGIQFNDAGQAVPYNDGSIIGGFFQIGGSGNGSPNGEGVSGEADALQNPFFRDWYLRAPSERMNFFASGDFELTDDIDLTVEASYGRVDANSVGVSPLNAVMPIFSGNPYMPASVQAVMDATGLPLYTIGRTDHDIGAMRTNQLAETSRLVVALEGELSNDWTWDAYYQYGKTNIDQVHTNARNNANFTEAVDAVIDPATGDIVCRSTLLGSTNGCQPFNVFGVNNFSAEAKSYITGTAFQKSKINQHVVSASMSGTPFKIWAGDVAVAFGAEYRKEKVAGSADDISLASGWYGGNGIATSGSFDATDVFAEFIAPLLSDGSAFGDALELNGAVRLTDYSTVGAVTTWKAGLVYDMNEWFRARATRSRDIRAPNLGDLFAPNIGGVYAVVDPESANTSVFAYGIGGGNANLTEETSNTFTAGIILRPKLIDDHHVSLSIDYFDIAIDGVITTPGAQVILDRCHSGAQDFCNLVTRGALGDITQIDNSLFNLNKLETSGIDIELTYLWLLENSAALNFRVLASHILEYATTDSLGTVDRAGQTGSPLNKAIGQPDWTVNTSVTYAVGALSTTLDMQYISSGIYDVDLIGPDNSNYDVSLPNSVNDNTVDSAFYTSISGQYDLAGSDGDSGHLQIFATINNLFDKDPAEAYNRTNFALFNATGRSYRVGLRYSF